MVDESWGQGVEFEVAHAIGTDHHGCILLVEGLHHLLQGLGRGVEVVAVELYGKAPATVVVDGCIPASSDAQVSALGDDVDEALVVEALQELGGLVGRVVIDHDDIELKTGLLLEGALYGVADGLFAIIDRDHH